jgi:hypothetical protein
MSEELTPTKELDWWLDRCDYYDPNNMPYIHYYNSWDDLKLMVANPPEEDENKSEFIEQRKQKVLSQWKQLIDQYFFQ